MASKSSSTSSTRMAYKLDVILNPPNIQMVPFLLRSQVFALQFGGVLSWEYPHIMDNYGIKCFGLIHLVLMFLFLTKRFVPLLRVWVTWLKFNWHIKDWILLLIFTWKSYIHGSFIWVLFLAENLTRATNDQIDRTWEKRNPW